MSSTTSAFNSLVQEQNIFFSRNQTKNIAFRKATLKKLLNLIEVNEENLLDAIYQDMGKSKLETVATELGIIKSEITFSLQHIGQWTKKKYVNTPLANIPAASYIISEPLGTTLIIGAWNYPLLLTLHPLISAIAAGNTVIIKPSELTPQCSRTIAHIINTHFDKSFIHVIEGGVKETTHLLQQKWDKIFFTGSTKVGKVIYEAAAKYLTPVTLELGGKSPAIVCADASIKISAKRIVWGKFINSGQTCVAPDYLLVDAKIKDKLIVELIHQIKQIYGQDPAKSEALVKIIDSKNFDRLMNLMDSEKVVHGGDSSKKDLFIAPTLLHPVSLTDPIMQEEIFGPLLPIIEYDTLEDAIEIIKGQPKPLSLYTFTENTQIKNRILHEVSFGGGCINETLVHLANHDLPFGGVGHSGMGNYHGKFGFDTFSHQKAIHDKPSWFELPIKYPPFTNLKLKVISWLLR